jgi:hypothetical protein
MKTCESDGLVKPYALSALLRGIEPTVPIVWKAGWIPESVWTLRKRGKSFAHAGERTPVVQARSLVAELTEALFRELRSM